MQPWNISGFISRMIAFDLPGFLYICVYLLSPLPIPPEKQPPNTCPLPLKRSILGTSALQPRQPLLWGAYPPFNIYIYIFPLPAPPPQNKKKKQQLEDDWPESIASHVCGRDKLASEFGGHSSTAAAILSDAKPIVCSFLRGPYARQRPSHAGRARKGSAQLCVKSLVTQALLRKCFVQLALCKLRCAKCSVQVALRELRCGSCSVQVALRKLLCASCSAQVARRKLLCASVLMQVALRELLCASCSAQVALRKLLCASCSAQVLWRDCALRTRFVLKICEFAAGAAGLPRGHRQKRKKQPRVFAPRPRRSPQKVARAPTQTKKKLEFLHLDHADPRRGPDRRRQERDS